MNRINSPLPEWARPPGADFEAEAWTNDAIVWRNGHHDIIYQHLNDPPPLQEHPFRVTVPDEPKNRTLLYAFAGAACGSMIVEVVARIVH